MQSQEDVCLSLHCRQPQCLNSVPVWLSDNGFVTHPSVTEGGVTEGCVTEGGVTEGGVTEGVVTEGSVTGCVPCSRARACHTLEFLCALTARELNLGRRDCRRGLTVADWHLPQRQQREEAEGESPSITTLAQSFANSVTVLLQMELKGTWPGTDVSGSV